MNLLHTWFNKSPTTSSGVVAWLEDVELGTGPLPVAPPPPALWPPLPPFGVEGAEEEFVVAVLSPTRLEEPRRLPLCTMDKKIVKYLVLKNRNIRDLSKVLQLLGY